MRTTNVILVSDTHVGSDAAVAPPNVRLDRGGRYELNPSQRWLYKCWVEFCAKAKDITGRKYILVHVGDIVDGVHHGSKEYISENLAIQRRLAIELLSDLVKDAQKTYFIRGTKAHSGAAAETEESIAEALGGQRDEETGAYSFYELLLRVNGRRIHFAHHVPTTRAFHYRTTPLMSELSRQLSAAIEWRFAPPDMYVRGHAHVYTYVKLPLYSIVVCPAWQLRTSFSYRINAIPSTIGGLVLRQEDWEDMHVYPILFRPKRLCSEYVV